MENNKNRYTQISRGKFTGNVLNAKAFIPTPSEFDYKKGFIRRYFVQKTNDKSAPITEVNSFNFGRYKNNPYYTLAFLTWRIKGPKTTEYNEDGSIMDKSVSESNRIAISLVKDTMPNLKLYLPNLLQFYKS